MQKRVDKLFILNIVGCEISLLILSIFAIGFLLSESNIVSAISVNIVGADGTSVTNIPAQSQAIRYAGLGNNKIILGDLGENAFEGAVPAGSISPGGEFQISSVASDGKISGLFNGQQEEVDFVVKEGQQIRELIQVCKDINNIETKQREIRSLLKASKELKCKNLLLITENYEGEEEAEWFNLKGKVKFIPVWKWLLNEK